MRIEEAAKYKTKNGTPYENLSMDYLEFIAENAKNPRAKEAAELLLEAKEFNAFESCYNEYEDDTPFDSNAWEGFFD